MRDVPRAGLLVALVLFALDQASKLFVTERLGLDSLSDAVALAPVFNLRFVANTGVSLGMLPADGGAMRWLLVAMTSAIAAGVAVWMFRETKRADQAALGLVLGGALGNILDRARLGYVVDFADLHFGEWRPFLVFNLADAAITVGVLILLIRAFVVRDPRPVEKSNA
jgi:signal peptidase II